LNAGPFAINENATAAQNGQGQGEQGANCEAYGSTPQQFRDEAQRRDWPFPATVKKTHLGVSNFRNQEGFPCDPGGFGIPLILGQVRKSPTQSGFQAFCDQ
jgi:hypothetical protein